MSFPVARLEWNPLPGERAHVVLSTDTEGPMACGVIPLEWLTNVPAKGHSATVPLCGVLDCDHGGTYREPRSVWTGQPVPNTP